VNKQLNAASGAAQKRLKEAHIDEFNKYMAEEASKRGQPWKPKASAKEKAKADFERLLAEHPEFADDLRVVEPVGSDDPDPSSEMGG
jgi:hypothetical protein